MKMTKDLGFWLALWNSVPEPAKAAVMSVVLGAVMALRSKERSFWGSVLEVAAGGVFTFLAGSGVEAFGFSSGWCFAIGGAVAMFGVDQVKAFAAKWAEKKSAE